MIFPVTVIHLGLETHSRSIKILNVSILEAFSTLSETSWQQFVSTLNQGTIWKHENTYYDVITYFSILFKWFTFWNGVWGSFSPNFVRNSMKLVVLQKGWSFPFGSNCFFFLLREKHFFLTHAWKLITLRKLKRLTSYFHVSIPYVGEGSMVVSHILKKLDPEIFVAFE